MKHIRTYKIFESDSVYDILYTLKDIYQESKDEGIYNTLNVNAGVIEMYFSKGWEKGEADMVRFSPKYLIECIERSSVYMEEQGYKISAIILRNRKGITNWGPDHEVEMALSKYEIDRIKDIPLVESVIIYFKRK